MKWIFNGELVEAGTIDEPQNATVVYEVLRVIDGIPLFWELHLQRFERSCALLHSNLTPQLGLFSKIIETLIAANQLCEGNIMCKFFYGSTHIDELYSIIPHAYPTEAQYLQGVQTNLLYAERTNPEAKVVQPSLRIRANQTMAEQNLYEVLLVNDQGLITEGSRSNVFFIRGNQLVSAPTQTILLGITFLKVVELCKKKGIEVDFEGAHASELHRFDAAFLSGTSPKILPVKTIGSQTFQIENALLQTIMQAYNTEIKAYIEMKKETIPKDGLS
jgi:branched-chain amino acid aminotransferase